MRLRRYRRRDRSHAGRFFTAALVLLLAAGCLMWLVNHRLQAIVETAGSAAARAVAISAINRAVEEELTENALSYSDIVHFVTDDNGNVAALNTDAIRLNRLQSTLSDRILNDLLASDEARVSIPLGNLIDGKLFSGRGPKLLLRLVPVGSVKTEIENLFLDAGINQTRHQIMLRISVQVAVLMPVSRVETTAETSLCIAETVLIGNVPETYTEILLPDENSILDAIN